MAPEHIESSLSRYRQWLQRMDYSNTEQCCAMQEKKVHK